VNGNIECACIGRVAAAPELKTSAGGKPWASFNVAVGQGDEAQWLRVVVFGDTAERLAGTLVKADRVYVEGALTMNTWRDREGEKRAGLNVAASKCERLGAIGRNRPPATKRQTVADHAARDWQRPIGEDVEIPF